MSSKRSGDMHCPIAAEVEQSLQRLQSLGLAMEANQALWRDRLDETKKFHQGLIRWAYETGAATRSLDYTLRKCTELRTHVLELLETLTAGLQNGKFRPAIKISQAGWLTMSVSSRPCSDGECALTESCDIRNCPILVL